MVETVLGQLRAELRAQLTAQLNELGQYAAAELAKRPEAWRDILSSEPKIQWRSQGLLSRSVEHRHRGPTRRLAQVPVGWGGRVWVSLEGELVLLREWSHVPNPSARYSTTCTALVLEQTLADGFGPPSTSSLQVKVGAKDLTKGYALRLIMFRDGPIKLDHNGWMTPLREVIAEGLDALR